MCVRACVCQNTLKVYWNQRILADNVCSKTSIMIQTFYQEDLRHACDLFAETNFFLRYSVLLSASTKRIIGLEYFDRYFSKRVMVFCKDERAISDCIVGRRYMWLS